MCCWQLLLALHAIYYLALKTQEGLYFHHLIQIDEMHDSNVLLKKFLHVITSLLIYPLACDDSSGGLTTPSSSCFPKCFLSNMLYWSVIDCGFCCTSFTHLSILTSIDSTLGLPTHWNTGAYIFTVSFKWSFISLCVWLPGIILFFKCLYVKCPSGVICTTLKASVPATPNNDCSST